jgi:hypothetical protein
MTGEKDYGRSVFEDMENYANEKYNNPTIFNPYKFAKYYAEKNRLSLDQIDRHKILKEDVKYLLESDLILIGKTDGSKGVEFELYVAKELGIPVEYFYY